MSRRKTNIPWQQRACVTVAEAEAVSGFGNSKIWELINRGRLRSTKIDGRRLIYVASLLALLGADASSAA